MHIRDLHKTCRIGESVLGSHLSKATPILEARHIAHTSMMITLAKIDLRSSMSAYKGHPVDA
jgi:hypothetical protein